jgi:MtfA peptidase
MRWPFTRLRPSTVDHAQWIDDPSWNALIEEHAFLARLDEERRARLRELCGAFLATKAINGARGLVVDEAVVARIAAQACVPILELGLGAYPSFDEIIVYPSEFVIDREIVDENGVVHEWSESAVGESWGDGPVILSWDATRSNGHDRPSPFAFNVVIHEFAHKLDMGNGGVDGMPAFSRHLHAGLTRDRWLEVLQTSFDDFNARLDAVERAIPRHVDPDSARADRYFAQLPLDAYAATDEGEFFSVSSEAFFVSPERLEATYPAWYRLLAAYYRQDPLYRN